MSEVSLVNEFLECLRLKGRKQATIDQYRFALNDFTEHVEALTAGSFPFAAKEEDAFTMRQALLNRGCNAWTVAKKLLCVHAFYEWLRVSGYLLVNPFPRPGFGGLVRLPRTIPTADTLHAAYQKLRCSDHLPEQRDYVTLDLGYACGLRRAEIHGLDVQDINQSEGTLRVRGKGGKERVVPVGAATMKDLLYYIYHIRPRFLTRGTTSALLLSWQKGGTRMNIRSINRAFGRIRRKYGLDRSFTPHGLRHAFATDLLRNGAAVQDVSRMLGHTKLETTQIYTRVLPVELKNHHKAFHPRG